MTPATPPAIFSPMQKLFLWACGFLMLAFIVHLLTELIIYIVISLFFAYIFLPAVDRMEFFFKNRVLAISILYIIFTTIVTLSLLYLVPAFTRQAAELSKDIPTYVLNLKSLFLNWVQKIEQEIPISSRLDLLENI